MSLGIFDCPHSTPQVTTSGPLIVRTQDIRSGVFRFENAARVSEETYRERTRTSRPAFGDLLYSREGTYFGIAAEVPPNTQVCLGQRMVLIKPDPDKVHYRFLRYWLNSPMLANHVNGNREGSVAERLNLPIIRALPILVPPLSRQQTIAAILGALDDKIELNRRMNATLEAMARAIFTSWFVDFDPVRAKMEGRQPFGMDAATAALFPDSLAPSSIGDIPSGWKVSSIGKIVEFAYGKALKAGVRRHGAVPVYGSNGQVGWHDEVLAKGPGIVVGRKGNAGTVTWVPNDFFPIDTTFYIVPRGPIQNMYYLFYALSILELASLGADSAVPGLNRNIAYMTEMLIPSLEIIGAFEENVAPLLAQVRVNVEEIRVLSAIRDALLPKLLSGEIRVA